MRRELLLGYVLLTLFHARVLAAGATCRDVNGLLHETGYHYIPGPEPCTLCVCDNGNPTLCKAVLCKYKNQESLPNKDCKTFRFGSTCCELICLDDAISVNDKTDGSGATIVDSTNYDLGLRLIASCITALLSLGLFIFLIHRLRRRKIRAGRQSHQLSDDQRSLGSIGYLDRNSVQLGMPMEDVPCNGGYPLWKPPSSYFPRGEAPPPYEEAVAAARAEQALLSVNPRTLSPLNFSGAYVSAQSAHGNVSIVSNTQNGLPASSPALSQNNASSSSPLITNNRPLSSPAAHSCYQVESTISEFCPGACASSFSMGLNTYENLPTPVNRSTLSNSVSNITSQPTTSSNQLLLPNSQNSTAQSHQQHTTLPRQGGAFSISATLPNSSGGVHRTIPRTLATSGSLRLKREYSVRQPIAPLFDAKSTHSKTPTKEKNPSPRSSNTRVVIPSSIPSTLTSGDPAVRTNAFYDTSCSRDVPSTSTNSVDVKPSDIPSTSGTYKPPLATANEVNEEGSFDSVTCTCSAQALPPLHDDTDDYRSECENCKSAHGSRYYLDNENEMVTSPHETMTLQRRPEDATSSTTPQYYRTSFTLPTSSRQRTRSSSSRGNWFSSMPESSTESSDGE
ncbi:uncharacterized protein LOC131674535 [Phymastichus coffea]|uniref:uncharacterized protein LOC131674535 n=1 Tax=Phymastichus coffea TaxID=108790 RepID=UPI00273B6B06|nr:uncharacterized protein LOC131674535 [Phymastichus coffea]